jgi:hypothetical protein
MMRPRVGANGRRYTSISAELKDWHQWGEDHFKARDSEEARERESLADTVLADQAERPIDLSDERLLRCLRKLNVKKAAGWDLLWWSTFWLWTKFEQKRSRTLGYVLR